MSENSRSRVTVTLGSGGARVVKRAGSALDDQFSDSMMVAGSKRSVRDRLGRNVDDYSMNENKRQRGAIPQTSIGISNSNDMRLSQHDLRFKLLQKNVPRQNQSNGHLSNTDLRNRLSRKATQPSNTLRPAEAAQPVLLARQSMAEPRDTSILGQHPSARTVSDFPVVVPARTSYSPWTLDNLRRRSPDASLRSSSTALSPENDLDQQPRRSIIQPFENGKSNTYIRSDTRSPSRPVSSIPSLAKSAVATATVSSKPVASLAPQFPPASGSLPKVSCMGEHSTMERFLQSLGLEKYSIIFKHEEVDMHALRHMGDIDLKELGVPMGPRKKILQALVSRYRRQP